MKPPQLLVPVEALGGRHPALEWARLNFDVRWLFPLYVHHPLRELPFGAGLVDVLRPAADDQHLAEARQWMAAFGQGFVRETGEPAREILTLAGSGEFSTVVMGQTAKGSLKRLMIGSVAEAVMHRSPLPVVIVRNVASTSLRPVRRILVLHDFSDSAKSAHQAAKRLFPQAEFHLVHVMEGLLPLLPSSFSEQTRQQVSGAMASTHQQHHDELTAALSALGPGEVYEGSAVDLTSQLVSNGPYDLIVMGQSARSSLDRLIVGSVAERLLRESPVPMLMAPGPLQA